MNLVYNSFRKDNILAAICIYITLIGSLVIIIKKLVSRRIVQRIPKSNILPQPTNDQEQSFEMTTLHSTPRTIQVGHINRDNTGDLLLLLWFSLELVSLDTRGWCAKFATRLNIKISIVQKVYEWSSCPFAKIIPPWVHHFGKRRV